MDLIILAAAAEAEEASGLSIILPAAAELFYGAISFIIVYVVMAKFAFPKLGEMLEQRGAAIQGKLEEADAKLNEAEAVKQQFAAQVADAKGEANRIIEEAKGTAESMRRDMLAKAEAEAQSIVARAQSEVSVERDRALQELRGEVSALSVDLAAKIVEKELDPAAHQQLVDQYIQKLSAQN